MKKRMWALVLAGVLVISQCDTVVLAADAAKTPVVYQATSVTPNKTSIDAVGGSVTFTVDGAVKSCVVKEGDTVLEQDKDYTVDDRSDSGKYIVIFNENTQAVARTFTVSLDGVETTITQTAKTSAEISSVTEVSSTKLADGRTEYVYNVEGTNLEEVGVVLFRNVNSKFDAGQYSVSREGTGNAQKVTVTIAAWADLNPDEFDEKKGVISGTTCFYPTSSGSQSYLMAKAQKSVEIKKEESSENPDVPQFDATTLKVKVVDKNGNPVPGVALYLKPDQKGYENLKLSVSDDNGKASYKCDNHHEMNDSTYTLLPTEDSGYICDSAIGIEFDQDDDWNSYITTVDSEKFTGQEVVLTVAKAEEPVTVTPDRTKISAGEESVMFTVSKPVEICVVKEGDKVLLEGTDYTVNNLSDTRYIVTFPENTQTVERVYTVILNGVETTITQAAKEAEASKISSVTQVSRTFLDDGRTEYVYNVTGANLKEVGVLVHKSFNSRFSTSQYTVEREGEGATQKVTVTIAPWNQLGEPFDEEINGFVRFYPTTSDMGSFNYSEQLDIELKKNETADVPAKAEITSVQADKTTLESTGDTVEFTVIGTNLDAANLEVSVDQTSGVTVGSFSGNATEQKVHITFPENTTTSDIAYKVLVNVKNETETKDVTVTVKGQEQKEATISSVTEVSRAFLSDGRTQYVYNVTGANLKEVGVLVHKSFNSRFSTSQYTVEREGEGATQKVTVTIAPWDQLGEPFDEEINGFIRFYPTTSGMGSFNYDAQLNIQVKKDEGKEEPTVVTPDKTKIPANGGQVRFAVSRKATNISITVDGKELVEDEDYEITSNWDDEIAIYFWENDSSAARTITVTLNGTSTQIVQEGKTESKISAVNLLSRTILEDGRTEYAYEVTGEALEAVGIRVKASINETVKEDKYEVKREGTGTKQIVTITFAPWSQLNILDEKEKELNWEIRFYPNGDRTGSYESADVKLIKDEKPAAADVIESMTVSAKEVDYVNGKTEVTVKGTDLNAENLEVSVESGVTVGEITGTSDELKFTVTFPTNPYTTAKDYKVSVNIRGKEDTKDATITVKGANTITGAEALKNPSYILDVRKEDTIAATGKIPGSQACPQFPTDDASLDEKMQAFAERYKDNTDPIYIMCNSGKVGAPRATKNLLAAGIDPARIFTILGGAGDADIQAALVKAPETDALKEAIAKAKEVDSAKYTTESYEAVANALKIAEEVLNKESATQAEVDDAVKALQTAMEGLEEKPEEPVAPVTDNLKAAIAKAKEVDSAKYTTESYKVVENALKAAEEVLDNANATQEDVNAAETALLAAMDGLKVKEETPSEEPEKPNDDKKTDDKKTDDKKTEDKKTGTSDKKSGSPQTGDAANALPFAVAALSSLMAAGVVVKKRKED